MLNFSNLNDIEFEYLCKDVMSRMLGENLQRFGKGRDGGIDLTDDVHRKTVIVQVKHYIKSDFAGLLSALRKEVPKVQKNNPKKYYVCCSKELTPQNKRDIYTMFSDYMESTNNIICITEISDFLEEEQNADILRKHFKLWIESTSILTSIFSNDICIDSDVLLSDINESVHMFVKTTAYDSAISCLEKNNVLIIVGSPGVGKTITSKMLVLSYAIQGYKIRYTTDGADLASLKKALAQSPDVKEIILLDDCFGQAYFNMKETQENELLALIKSVKMSSNKILIMNSRVTIYQEATLRTPSLVNSLDKKEYRAYVLDMSNVSLIEKAKIFYNHLYFGGVPTEYRENIKCNRNYIKIVKHDNYNPRVIEFVTNRRRFEQVDSSLYAEFILECLNNPEQIWENEYSRRISNIDRMLLNTLYSLTNTNISMDVVRRCFEHRLGRMTGIDFSINHFEQSVKRLQNSMIKIVDDRGSRTISVANPSVNDFLHSHLERNVLEKQQIIKHSICFRQLKRLLSNGEYEFKLRNVFEDESILKFVFESEKQKREFIVSYCTMNQICNVAYKTYFEDYILLPEQLVDFRGTVVPFSAMYRIMLEKGICSFYHLNDIICDISKLKLVLSNLMLEEMVRFVNQIDAFFSGKIRDDYIEIVVRALKETIDLICSDVYANEYDVDISDIIEGYRYERGHRGIIDADAAVVEIDNMVEAYVLDDIYESLSKLPNGICDIEKIMGNLSVHVSGSDSMVESYLADDYPDYYYDEYREKEFEVPEIEYIFER